MLHMSDGTPYLADGVHSPTMGRNCDPETDISEVLLRLTASRLFALVTTVSAVDGLIECDVGLLIWDWKTGKACLVSHLTFVSLYGTSDPLNR